MTEAQNIKLYSKLQVAVSTFLGAPIAGALLMRRNYTAMGQREAAQKSLMIGIVGTVALLVLAFFLPPNFPKLVIPIASLLAVRQWYSYAQEETFQTHAANGGETAWWGAALCTGLLCLMGVMALLVAVNMLLPAAIPE